MEWLKKFIAEERAWDATLASSTAGCSLAARAKLFDALEAALLTAEARPETVSVEEAAALTGVNPETARRAVRRKELTDLRGSPRQTIRILKNELPLLAAKRRARKVGSSANTERRCDCGHVEFEHDLFGDRPCMLCSCINPVWEGEPEQ